ncbi:MAG: hypothetical protein O7E52_15920 [Candidatus Poribacteria bacterium]|nr:hypothetical protein [Candidatus Poribacteria bacterium]
MKIGKLVQASANRSFGVTLVVLWFFIGLNPASSQVVDEDFRAPADVFLRNLTAAEHQGMGGSFAGSISGANALNSNPAGLSFIDSNRFVTHVARFPRTVAVIARLNEAERYEDYGQYDLRASGLEFVNYSVPLGTGGAIGFDFAYGHEGRFSRVDHLGKATNSFPENELAVGIGYAVRLFGQLSLGIDARWLRSKVQDVEDKEHVGHGYAYNLGVIQQYGEHLRIGGVIRNLSNGLSFTEVSIPDRIKRDILLGGAYRFHHEDVDAQFSLDVNPPFDDGFRTHFGGEIWYRRVIGGRIGYLRHTEERFDPILILETEEAEFGTRLWKAEGITLGLGLRIGMINVNAAYTPQMKPTEGEREQIRIEQGESVFSFSIGQGV